MISVIVPALNEELAIGSTIVGITSALNAQGIREVEVVVVNDGSTDNTASIAESSGAVVVSHLYNLGYGRSLKDGIRAAKYDTILIIDADGTYPFDAASKLISEYNRGFDMVVGRRTGKFYDESWIKLPLRSILKFLVEFTAGQKIPDINSGMRVFSRSTVMPYFDQLCNTFSFTTSMTLAYLLTGRFVGYIDIPYGERIGQKKVQLVKDACRTFQYIVQAALYYNPLKIFFLLTIMILIFSGICFVAALPFKTTTLFLLGISGILASMLVFSLGLLSDQLRQVLLKISKNPASASAQAEQMATKVVTPRLSRAQEQSAVNDR